MRRRRRELREEAYWNSRRIGELDMRANNAHEATDGGVNVIPTAIAMTPVPIPVVVVSADPGDNAKK